MSLRDLADPTQNALWFLEPGADTRPQAMRLAHARAVVRNVLARCTCAPTLSISDRRLAMAEASA